MACRLRKLMYRVVFPFELKLGNTSEACDAADSVYNLFAVVVHIGSGMNHGKLKNMYWPCYVCTHLCLLLMHCQNVCRSLCSSSLMHC